MADNDIIITVNDYVNKSTTTYQIHDISNDMKISEIIEIIKRKKNYNKPVNNFVIYFARTTCNHDETLAKYNKSNRKAIKLEIHLSVILTINVKMIQSCGSGNTRCIPLWAFLCTQTIKIKISDTSEVRSLKQKIYDMTDERVALPIESIVLIYKGAPLNNFLTLKESELTDNCTVKYFVPLCYNYKKKANQKKDENKNDEEDFKKGISYKSESVKSSKNSDKSKDKKNKKTVMQAANDA